MTRIDPIHHNQVSILNDSHLGSSWNEVPRVITHVENLIINNKTYKAPEKFTFNTGHVKFFYDKIKFIEDRLKALYDLSVERNKNYSYELLQQHLKRCQDIKQDYPEFYNDWEPSQTDVYLGMARLIERKFKTKMAVVGRTIKEG